MPEPLALVLALAVVYSLVIVEALLVLWALWISRTTPNYGRRWFQVAERLGRQLARRPRLSILAVSLAVLAARAALAPVLPIREPRVTDEFSYLLAADTFASGRLSNPPHPMWRHFESMHILQQPTYSSMYQPAQGLVLAAAQKVLGHPWIGVYLSMGLMCAAICWMLQGWLPPAWALLGASLVVMRLALFSYWMNSYWGGAVAATGGALALGALPRYMRRMRRPRLRDSLAMAAGAAILVSSRPYEGGVMCAAVGAVVLTSMFGKNRPPLRTSLSRFLVPMLLVLSLTAGALGFYFFRVTGSPFKLPEQVQRAQYAMAPIFLWQSPKPQPVYRHYTMYQFYAVWEMKVAPEIRSAGGLAWNAAKKAIDAWMFYVGPALTVPFVFFPAILKDRCVRILLFVGAVAVAGMGLNAWFYPHYAAPITGLLFVIVVQGIRRLRVWRRSTGAGLFLARAIPAICLVMIVVRLAAQPFAFLFPPDFPMTWYHTSAGNVARARVLAKLAAMDGSHVAIVRYGPTHRAVMNEWVYNQADVDRARVVWAREMDASNNRELIRYFHRRHVWLVEADEIPPKVSPYPQP
jgi:hypothetical protein